MTLRLLRTSHNISIIALSDNVVFPKSPQHKKLRRGGEGLQDQHSLKRHQMAPPSKEWRQEAQVAPSTVKSFDVS